MYSYLQAIHGNVNQELDQWCEDLIREEFGESCNFDVDDAVQKLEKLGIVTKVDSLPKGLYFLVWLSLSCCHTSMTSLILMLSLCSITSVVS